MSKSKVKQRYFVIQKIVYANSIRSAIQKEKAEGMITNVSLATEHKDQLAPAIGFMGPNYYEEEDEDI